MYKETGIDLENIVYYKDDTHYFVMTAKKHSLLDKGVLLNVSEYDLLRSDYIVSVARCRCYVRKRNLHL